MSYYFHRVLHACLGLYRKVVTNATIHNSPYEKDNVKPWYSYFQDVVEAIDGTHISANVPVDDQARYRNRKQVISQNVLVACTFDIKFTYARRLGGIGTRCTNAKCRSLISKYYLADARFSLVPGFLSSYRRTRYHRRDIEDDVCEEDFDTSDDEVNPTHADVPEDATINARISFTADALWSNNRDAMAQSIWVNHNPNADAEIEFD
ncbi:putative harbinger transposase-derived nuclease [Abeliophyllum distichum]|uniref:Harbinger transposase-derived nuclease n=1 Tax=Abeliophyllum distichum TaxID=126358 RepID=A0ABD1T221_9LAMI